MFRPRLEFLEAREVPAVNWTWTPQMGSTNGGLATNWTNDGGLVNQIPDDNNDNVTFNNMQGECDLTTAQGTLGKITVANNYTNKIVLGGVNTAFTGCSVLGACTIDLNGKQANFGGTAADPGAIGSQAGGGTLDLKGDYSFVGDGTHSTDLVCNGTLLKSGGTGNADFGDVDLTGTGVVTINPDCGTIETLLRTYEVGSTPIS